MTLRHYLHRHFQFFLVMVLAGFLTSCEPRSAQENEELDYRTRIRLKQYIIQGRNLYQTYCSNCHQEDGAGFGQLYPPLKNSSYMLDSLSRTLCIIKYGQKGPIVVNDVEYDLEMPANPDLSNLEIAEIATYIFNEFGNQRQLIDVRQVDSLIIKCE